MNVAQSVPVVCNRGESHVLGNVLRVILALIIYKHFFSPGPQINLRMPSDWSSALHLTKQLLPFPHKTPSSLASLDPFSLSFKTTKKQESGQPQLTLGELRKNFLYFWLLLVLGLENG